MDVEVKLFAYLREGRVPVQKIQIGEGSTAEEIVDILKIRKNEISLMFINGKDAPFDYVLNDGDVISLFPPVGGG